METQLEDVGILFETWLWHMSKLVASNKERNMSWHWLVTMATYFALLLSYLSVATAETTKPRRNLPKEGGTFTTIWVKIPNVQESDNQLAHT